MDLLFIVCWAYYYCYSKAKNLKFQKKILPINNSLKNEPQKNIAPLLPTRNQPVNQVAKRQTHQQVNQPLRP